MVGICDADERRADAPSLYGALAERCRIGELMMIEDVVEVDAFHAGAESIERCAAQRSCVDALTEPEIPDFIVVARLPVVQVYAEKIGVETHAEFLPLAVFMREIDVVDVESIAKEYPSPPEIRTELIVWLRREDGAVVAIIGYAIGLKRISILQHKGIVVVLRLNIVGINTAETFQKAHHLVTYRDIEWCHASVVTRWPGEEADVVHGQRVYFLIGIK